MIDYKPGKQADYSCGINSIIIGMGHNVAHSHCIVIGSNLKTTKDNQILIGNKEIEISGVLDTKDTLEILELLKSLLKVQG